MSENYVVLLGTKGGPAIRPGSPMPTSNLLHIEGHDFVIDCGLGVTSALCETGFELKNLKHIFITHLHSDHYLELGPLLHTAWTAGLTTTVNIFGPSGLQDYIDGFSISMKADIDLRIEDEGRPSFQELINFHPLAEGMDYTIDGIQISVMKNIHPPLIETFALKFLAQESCVIFSGDTAYSAELAKFAKNANLLIHEAMLLDGVNALVARVGNGDERLLNHLLRSHTAAAQVGKLAALAGVKQLAINHKIPSDDPDFTNQDWEAEIRKEWQGPLHIGEDGMKIEL